MDEALRQLERAYDANQDEESLDAILHFMLRLQNFEAWRGEKSYFANKFFPFLDRKMHSSVDKWANCYEDFTARATIFCHYFKDLEPIQQWLQYFYAKYPIFYSGREVNLVNEEPFFDPSAKVKVNIDDAPCFNFAPRLKKGEKREINLWSQRERFVSFRLVEFEDFEAAAKETPDEDALKVVQISPTERVTEISSRWPQELLYEVLGAEPEEIGPEHERYLEFITALGFLAPHWINVYEVTRAYGGPEEGGWDYDYESPLACVYVGLLPVDREGQVILWHQVIDQWPEHVKEAYNFLEGLFIESDGSPEPQRRRRSEEPWRSIRLSTEIGHETGRQYYE